MTPETSPYFQAESVYCVRDKGHSGPCNGLPRIDADGRYCYALRSLDTLDHEHQVNRYGVCRICAQRAAYKASKVSLEEFDRLEEIKRWRTLSDVTPLVDAQAETIRQLRGQVTRLQTSLKVIYVQELLDLVDAQARTIRGLQGQLAGQVQNTRKFITERDGLRVDLKAALSLIERLQASLRSPEAI